LLILDAISAATTVAELLELLLKLFNLQSKDVERLEKKWDIKQHADFRSAVEFLRLARIDSTDLKLIDVDQLKRGFQELLKSRNYYADLQKKGVLDNLAELETIYVISGWLLAQCYLKIQQINGQTELIEDAVRLYLSVIEFVWDWIQRVKAPLPPQPIRFFHMIDDKIFAFLLSGSLFVRIFKIIIVIALAAIYPISLPYIIIDILVRILGYGLYGKPKIDQTILNKLNEMYLISLVEVSPYINRQIIRSLYPRTP
jgi:hypothetical protein